MAVKADADYKKQIKILVETALLGLSKMYDSDSALFAKRIVKSEDSYKTDVSDIRYTLINLLGLNKAIQNKINVPLNINAACRKQLKNIDRNQSIGEVGLTLWLFGQYNPALIEDTLKNLDIQKKFEFCADAQQELTVELSWLLTGICELGLSGVYLPPAYENLANRIFQILCQNYPGKGIFKHSTGLNVWGKFKSNIGSFADQVYPIIALAKYSQLKNDQTASDIAAAAADKIVEHQGALGQWWWHYNAPTGKVFSQFPVYGVHQDAMGPMALFEIQKLKKIFYQPALKKSVAWIFNRNEFNTAMLEPETGMIWRNIRPGHFKRYASELLQICHLPPLKISQKDLSILHECWSYHLGWVLYAFSDLYREYWIEA